NQEFPSLLSFVCGVQTTLTAIIPSGASASAYSPRMRRLIKATRLVMKIIAPTPPAAFPLPRPRHAAPQAGVRPLHGATHPPAPALARSPCRCAERLRALVPAGSCG